MLWAINRQIVRRTVGAEKGVPDNFVAEKGAVEKGAEETPAKDTMVARAGESPNMAEEVLMVAVCVSVVALLATKSNTAHMHKNLQKV